MRNCKKLLKFRFSRCCIGAACHLILIMLVGISGASAENQEIINPQYLHVKQAVFSEPYSVRPTYLVNKKLFGKVKGQNGSSNQLLNAAKRTLTDSRDLIEFPNKQKLLQANGICFAGIWTIQQNHSNNPFDGLFAKGTIEPVIVRASVALSGTKQKDKRAFGMAIKFFPKESTTSLNAFLLHSFGGVIKKHVLDLKMDNQPTLGSLPRWKDIGTALRLKKDLEKADKSLSRSGKSRFSFRPINHLANFKNPEARSPKWLRLETETTQRIDEDDFRDELDVRKYQQQQIIYSVSVADHTEIKSDANWITIGHLSLNESITSAACDQRLHFRHPRLD